ncbi:MAG: zinc ribbon domain-containing protein [Acidobacteria bacterium]|nr:zinc ribbon domain-containing protein [Acidobacteriota bacterium]
MGEVSALDKHLCPACGAEANWNASKQALVCPYCGTTSPGELASDGSVIKEHDLVAALRAIPGEKRGWGNDRVAVQCKSCQAITLFEPTRVAQRCDFCGSPAIVPYEKTRNAIAPESLLPFQISEPQVRESMRRWYGSRWFAPNRLKNAAFTDTVHGIYVPYWTFDAHVDARWAAEAGYYYYVTVRRSGRLQQVRKVRWEAAAGELSLTFDDELVAATQGVHAKLLRGVEPFPTASLKPYDRGYVSGWVVEQYQIDLVAAAMNAKRAIEAKVHEACASDVPGDTYRNLQVNATFSDETFKHVLLPLWLLSYTYGRNAFQVVVNGVTGTIAGERPWSWIKILLVVVLALIALAIVGRLEG